MCRKALSYIFKSCFLFFIIFSIGCSTLKVNVMRKVPKVSQGSTIAYFNNSFSERYFPTLLSISGTVYRNRSNENIEKFNEIEKITGKEIADLCSDYISQKTASHVKIIQSPLKVKNFDTVKLSTAEKAKIIANECKKINATYAVIPIMRVNVDEVWGMGESGNNYFESKVYICNSDGKVIGGGYISTEAQWVEPKDTTTYHIIIKSSGPLFKKLINSLF